MFGWIMDGGVVPEFVGEYALKQTIDGVGKYGSTVAISSGASRLIIGNTDSSTLSVFEKIKRCCCSLVNKTGP